MANVKRTYATLDMISTLAKREKLLKPRAFKQAMRDLHLAVAAEAGATECAVQDRDLCAVVGRAATEAYKVGASAFDAAFLSQREFDVTGQRALLDLMHSAFSLARAIDGSNAPNVAYYSLLLKAKASTVLTIAFE